MKQATVSYRLSAWCAAMCCVAALTACGEKPQTARGNGNDVAAYQGTGSHFTQPGWQAGDKTSWEQHLRSRQLYGQNEYSRNQR